jgi:hypothetical protein
MSLWHGASLSAGTTLPLLECDGRKLQRNAVVRKLISALRFWNFILILYPS